MAFTDDKYVVPGQGQGSVSDAVSKFEEKSSKYTDQRKEKHLGNVRFSGPTINKDNPFATNDHALIIRTFESEASNWAEDDYNVAFHYKDVYTLRRFTYRVQQQMNYYPGMHQSEAPPETDPAREHAAREAEKRLDYWNRSLEDPDAFMSGLKSRQRDFGDQSGLETALKAAMPTKDGVQNLAKLLKECTPCFDRLLDGENLLPDMTLLDIHLLNIKMKTDILDKLKSLLSDPGHYLDICELLKYLSNLCPQDLLAILALLSQYLAKLNLDIKFNLDLIVQLVGPILSPFLDSLAAWLDKWIQMILAPLICIVDNINETMMLAQQMKIPLSEASGNVDFDIGTALPFHQNASSESGAGFDMKSRTGWAETEGQRFETPDEQKYNPTKPEPPADEVGMSASEVAEGWRPSFSETERQERDQRWAELRKRENEKRRRVPPPLTRENPDGHRWYKEDADSQDLWEAKTGMRPPEEQAHPKPIDEYYLDASPIINSVVQLRNIMQAGIAYIQDWFEYVTQMIHDLIGTDFGWMGKKTDSSILKSRIIQLIFVVKALIEAISKNGLKCGLDSNFDEGQLQYVLETAMNNISVTYQFQVNPDGDVIIRPPDGPLQAETINLAQGHLDQAGRPKGAEKLENEQKSVASGIIIKDCLKGVTDQDLSKVRQWIAEFERNS